MGNFIGVYDDNLDKLKSVIGSGKSALVDEILHDQESNEEEIGALRKLIHGYYAPGEQTDGAHFIRAFEAICRKYAKFQTTVEIYVDEELFPEIFQFVWKGDGDPFGLPLSEYGAPACGHWETKEVPELIKKFRGLNFDDLEDKTGSNYEDAIGHILTVLEKAKEANEGVFVFYGE